MDLSKVLKSKFLDFFFKFLVYDNFFCKPLQVQIMISSAPIFPIESAVWSCFWVSDESVTFLYALHNFLYIKENS